MPPKVAHLLVVGAICLTIYGYASYCTEQEAIPPRPRPSPLSQTLTSPNTTNEDWSRSNTSSPTITQSSPSVVNNTIITLPVSTVQSIINNTSPKTTADLTKGIITRTLYSAGHDLPRPEICPDLGSELKLIVVIMSAPSHFEARMAIRQTWGHYATRKDVAIAFLLGASEDENLNVKIKNEGVMYSDVIRGRFFDSYNNLTLKTISMMEWVSDYCPKAKFLLKTDDDMFINIPKLILFADKHVNDKKVIFGRLAKRWKPIRNKKSKYYVSKLQYKAPVFPDFTTGPAYLLSPLLTGDLYKAALDQTYLKLEDVYTTGVVAQKIGLRRIHAAEFLNKRVPMNACTVQRAISIHMVKFSEQFDLWKKLLDGKSKCK